MKGFITLLLFLTWKDLYFGNKFQSGSLNRQNSLLLIYLVIVLAYVYVFLPSIYFSSTRPGYPHLTLSCFQRNWWIPGPPDSFSLMRIYRIVWYLCCQNIIKSACNKYLIWFKTQQLCSFNSLIQIKIEMESCPYCIDIIVYHCRKTRLK